MSTKKNSVFVKIMAFALMLFIVAGIVAAVIMSI